jgi:hypothetical protein
MLIAISKVSRNAANEGHDDGKQENDQEVERDETYQYNEVIFGEGDLILSWSIGPTGSFMCWNSSVRRINNEITGSGGNLEQWPNTTSSCEVLKK